MKYKALMIDLDGTTVPHFTDDISPRVINAIKKAHDSVTVCLVTGRLLSMTKNLITKLEISGPCVLNNGAQIYDPITHTTLLQLCLDRNDLAFIHKTIHAHIPSCIAYDGEKEISGDQWESLERVVNFYVPDTTPAIVQRIIDDFHDHPRLTTNRMLGTTTGKESVEVIHSRATKQFGIFEVAKILGIKTHEIIGVGDGYNDFPLLMACGLKVAMGNAVAELKAIADFVAPPVDEDGLAIVIEKFILEK